MRRALTVALPQVSPYLVLNSLDRVPHNPSARYCVFSTFAHRSRSSDTLGLPEYYKLR